MAEIQEQSSRSPRKRRRPALSCEQCRRRKVKCDRKEPCGPCARARRALKCSYINDEALHSDQSEVETGSSVLVTLGVRDLRPTHESVDESSHEHSNQLSSVLSNSVESQSLYDIRQRLQRLERTPIRPEHHDDSYASLRFSQSQSFRDAQQALPGMNRLRTELNHQATSTPLQVSSGTQPSEPVGSYIPVTTPRLRIAPNKTKLFGSNHWLHTAEKFQVIGRFDAKEVEPSPHEENDGWVAITKDCRNLRHSIKRQQSTKLNEPVPNLLSTIPARSVCDDLVQHYLNTFELMYRIIHVPTFRREYEQFWDQPQSASAHFVMKLVLILAVGTTFYSHHNKQLRYAAQSWIYAAQWWLTGPSEKHILSLDGLQVYCLLLIARQTNSLGGSSSISTASLLRIAMTMGLHRSPKLFPALSVFQAEIRVRLWTAIVEMSVQSSLDTGVPLLLDLRDFDPYAPSNIDDDDICPRSTAVPIAKSSYTYTESSISILLLKSLPSRIAVVKELNCIGQETHEHTLKLGTEIRTACRDLAAFFNSLPPSRHGVLQPTEFHRDYLDMYLRWYILCLHRPFMLQARADPRFYLSRKICLESSTIIASYGKYLQLPDHAPNNLGRLMMNGSGWLKGALSLDVMTCLGLEIVTQLEEEETNPRRSRTSRAADPLDVMAEAARAPLIQSLEHILAQSLHAIALGTPRVKRYIFLSAILGQIRAMQSCQPVKRTVRDAIIESLKRSYTALQASQVENSSREQEQQYETALPNESSFFEHAASDLFEEDLFDFANLNSDMVIDFPSLLLFPGVSNGI